MAHAHNAPALYTVWTWVWPQHRMFIWRVGVADQSDRPYRVPSLHTSVTLNLSLLGVLVIAMKLVLGALVAAVTLLLIVGK